MFVSVRKLGEVFVSVPLAALARARPTYNPLRISAIDTAYIGGRLCILPTQCPWIRVQNIVKQRIGSVCAKEKNTTPVAIH